MTLDEFTCKLGFSNERSYNFGQRYTYTEHLKASETYTLFTQLNEFIYIEAFLRFALFFALHVSCRVHRVILEALSLGFPISFAPLQLPIIYFFRQTRVFDQCKEALLQSSPVQHGCNGGDIGSGFILVLCCCSWSLMQDADADAGGPGVHVNPEPL